MHLRDLGLGPVPARRASFNFLVAKGRQYAGLSFWRRLPSTSGPVSTTSSSNGSIRLATAFLQWRHVSLWH